MSSAAATAGRWLAMCLAPSCFPVASASYQFAKKRTDPKAHCGEELLEGRRPDGVLHFGCEARLRHGGAWALGFRPRLLLPKDAGSAGAVDAANAVGAGSAVAVGADAVAGSV